MISPEVETALGGQGGAGQGAGALDSAASRQPWPVVLQPKEHDMAESSGGDKNGTEPCASRPAQRNATRVCVFLSYAEEDHEAADNLKRRLSGERFEVYDWQDLARQGKEIVEDIEKGIARAHAFLLFLSPHYLTSPWCRAERNLAVHHQMERKSGEPDAPSFIQVLKVADTGNPDLGFLRDHRQIDLSSPKSKEAIDRLVKRLHAAGEAVSAVPATSNPGQVSPSFRNRHDELRAVVRALTNAGSQHFWVVVAPPQLGKSWFLDRLSAVLPPEPADWVKKLVDLSEEPQDVRGNAALILARFFDRPSLTRIGPRTLPEIAASVIEGGRPYLCLLDGADLLDPGTVTELRSHLSKIYRLLREAGKRNVRLAFVAASRRQDEWKGVYPTRLSPLPLTEFNVYVVNDALHDMAQAEDRAFSDQELWRTAERVHRLSEGLPALLTRALRWVQEAQWVGLDYLESPDLFRQFTGTYINDRLFSRASLFPLGGRDLEGPRDALEAAFRVLAPYRLFTVSHLDRHVESDADFKAVLDLAGWPVYRLWRAIGRTALVSQPLHEPWQEVLPAIRRLLFRYYYPTEEQQSDAHRTAREFYERWGKDRPAGSEQGTVLVESLWHEAARLKLDPSSGMEEPLIEYASERSQILATSAFEEEELRVHTARLMRDDHELQEAAGPDLFERLVSIVEPPLEESSDG